MQLKFLLMLRAEAVCLYCTDLWSIFGRCVGTVPASHSAESKVVTLHTPHQQDNVSKLTPLALFNAKYESKRTSWVVIMTIQVCLFYEVT